MTYVEIQRAGQHPERWQCERAEPIGGALVMSGNVRSVPASFDDGARTSVIVPFRGFDVALIDVRGESL